MAGTDLVAQRDGAVEGESVLDVQAGVAGDVDIRVQDDVVKCSRCTACYSDCTIATRQCTAVQG